VNGTVTTGDNDYVAKTGPLTFAPGETTKTITIEVKGDNRKEANETFYLDLFESQRHCWDCSNMPWSYIDANSVSIGSI